MRDKLLALPVATYYGFLLFNAKYLSAHSFSLTSAPKTMSELGEMMSTIMENEKAMEHYVSWIDARMYLEW
jgi:maltose-binding protein MalE